MIIFYLHIDDVNWTIEFAATVQQVWKNGKLISMGRGVFMGTFTFTYCIKTALLARDNDIGYRPSLLPSLWGGL